MKLSPEMQELFSRDPLEMDDADVRKIIEEMRRHREAFMAKEGPIMAKKAPARGRTSSLPRAAPDDLLAKLDSAVKGK